MIGNVFSITQQDGLLNSQPDGVFTSTSTLPTTGERIIKGNSDFVCINDGLPGAYEPPSSSYNCASIAFKENGEMLSTDVTSHHLKGTTVYGYLLTYEQVTHSDGRTFPTAVINLITNPGYKTGVPTYKGFGRMNLSISADSKTLHAYGLTLKQPASFGGETLYYNFAPLYFSYEYHPNSSYPDNTTYMSLAVLYLDGSTLAVQRVLVPKKYEIVQQHTDDETYMANYGAIPVTILDSDVIIPSLEDRVAKLETEMANVPSTIKAGLALATKEVSKLYASR